MPYRFLDNITTSDVGFVATGSTLEEVLLSSWDAALKTMAEGEILRVKALTLMRTNDLYEIRAQLFGEPIDPLRHEMIVDVKAVTFHRLAVDKLESGWRATVVLDV
jgi:SHS2 domain-containing protein